MASKQVMRRADERVLANILSSISAQTAPSAPANAYPVNFIVRGNCPVKASVGLIVVE